MIGHIPIDQTCPEVSWTGIVEANPPPITPPPSGLAPGVPGGSPQYIRGWSKRHGKQSAIIGLANKNEKVGRPEPVTAGHHKEWCRDPLAEAIGVQEFQYPLVYRESPSRHRTRGVYFVERS